MAQIQISQLIFNRSSKNNYAATSGISGQVPYGFYGYTMNQINSDLCLSPFTNIVSMQYIINSDRSGATIYVTTSSGTVLSMKDDVNISTFHLWMADWYNAMKAT